MSASSVTEKLETTLQTLVGLEGVRSAFIMDRLGTLKVHKSKGKDSHQTLSSMARYLHPVLIGMEQAGNIHHLHLRYTMAAFFFRMLATGQYLVLFLETSASLPALLPSLNLSVLGLEKALQSETADSMLADQSLVHLVNSALNAIEVETKTDATFYGSLRRLAFDYFGKTGCEILTNGIEALWISLPISRPNDMQSIVDYALERLAHPVKRQCFQQDAEALIKKHSGNYA